MILILKIILIAFQIANMRLNCFIDESSNVVANDDDPQVIFEWNDPGELDLIRIQDFTESTK